MTQAVILAGGKGTRLAERLLGKPKPLIEIDGEPLLGRQIRSLTANGVEHVVVLVNHRADLIEDFIRSNAADIRITVLDDGPHPLGTAGAMLKVLDHLQDQFLVVYGDTLFDIDIAHMLEAHRASGADATLLLHPNDHPADSDLVEVDANGWIRAFHGYPHATDAVIGNLVNAAMYVCDRSALLPWAGGETLVDLAKDLFPAMLRSGARLKAYRSYEYIKDAGTPKRVDKIEHHLLSGVVGRASRRSRQRAVFMDRDGTLNKLKGYIVHPSQITLLPGVADAVRLLNDAEYRLVVVTNQPVIARGDCDLATLASIHDRLTYELGKSGAYLDEIRFCPHHPDSGYAGEVSNLKCVCSCRKPSDGMLLSAAEDMNIDLRQSWMIGDSSVDIKCGSVAGVTTVLVLTGEAGLDGRVVCDPDFVVTDMAAAAKLVAEVAPKLEAELLDLLAGAPLQRVNISDGSSDDRRIFSALLNRLRARVGVDPHDATGIRVQPSAEVLAASASGWADKVRRLLS
jgi:D,D-heptose 1,7-bisphosphate phosphatase